MAKQRIIAGLDVGTSYIRVALAGRGGDGSFDLLGIGMAPALGMRRGAVVDTEEVAVCIRTAVQDAMRNAGVSSVDHAYVSFGGSGLAMFSSKGVVAVTRADGEISVTDVERAQAAARSALPSLANREILHEIPVRYAVDRESGVKDPIGMIGTRLEVESIFLTAFAPQLRQLLQSVEATGIPVEGVVVSPLAASRSTLSKYQKEIGVLALDLGGGTVSLAVFEEGALISAGTFPIGSAHITHDIAIGFQLPVDIAERLKVAHGTLRHDLIGKREGVRLADFSSDLSAVIARKDLADIIEARAADIFELVGKHLRKMGHSGLLPAGVVLTGGGAGLHGLVDFTKHQLQLPAAVGVPVWHGQAVEAIADPSWAVAVGLCLWAQDHEQSGSALGTLAPTRLFEGLMRLIRPLIP